MRKSKSLTIEQRESRSVLGIAFMLLSCMFLTVGDALSKLLTTTYSVGEIIFARSVVILVIGIAICAWRGTVASIKPHNLRSQMRRAVYFVISTFLVNWSFKLLPLAVAHAILFAATNHHDGACARSIS